MTHIKATASGRASVYGESVSWSMAIERDFENSLSAMSAISLVATEALGDKAEDVVIDDIEASS